MKRPLHICWTANLISEGGDRGYVMHAGFTDTTRTLCGYATQEHSMRNMGDTDQPDCLKCRKILAALREQWAGELPLKHV